MTKQEIIAKMDEIETKRFYLAMKDRWNRQDFEHDSKLFDEWMTLNNQLKEINEND